MALVEVLLPSMGEGIIEATLISWMKNEGEHIALDENIIEVATDKVNSEVPSTSTGVLHKKLFGENDVIPVGQPFAIISTSETDSTSDLASPIVESSKITEEEVAEIVTKEIEKIEQSVENIPSNLLMQTAGRFYSPLVMNMAKEEGMTQSELDTISGTGASGRVTKEDMIQYLANRKRTNIQESSPSIQSKQIDSIPLAKSESIKLTQTGDTEVVKMDRMRKLIADHMVKSVQTSPHVCSFIEADVTNLVQWRTSHKDKFKEIYGENLTYTPIIFEAIIKAIREFPMINSSTDGENIFVKKNINLGMAAALPDGNLIVPVIKDADTLNLHGLAKKVNELGTRAKKNQLKPDEISGGTYTVTNLGSFGNLFGTPIINQPQVAILGIGAIVKKPVVIESPKGDTIGIRSMMYLSHSYDHRVVDGMLGGSFVKRVAEILESFDIKRPIS